MNIFRALVSSKEDTNLFFSIDQKEIPVMFQCSNNEIRLMSKDSIKLTRANEKDQYKCIKIDCIHPEVDVVDVSIQRQDVIELTNYYFLLGEDQQKEDVCPPLSHKDFFNLLDVIANAYQTNVIRLDDMSYKIINGYEVSHKIMSMSKRGRTFYNIYGFYSPELTDVYRELAMSEDVDDDFILEYGSNLYEATTNLIKEISDAHSKDKDVQERVDYFDHYINTMLRTLVDEEEALFYRTPLSYLTNITRIDATTVKIDALNIERGGRGTKRKRKRRTTKNKK